jgi:threonine/homoserine/homoserine lactone efflux protein
MNKPSRTYSSCLFLTKPLSLLHSHAWSLSSHLDPTWVILRRYGRRAGFAATIGIALGLLIAGLGAALGLSALVSNSHLAYEALRWSGVAYLFWLAWDGWRDAAETSPTRTNGHSGAGFFMRGLITNLLNPKAAIFYVAVLPTFVNETSSALGQAAILSVAYVLIATAIHSLIVSLAGAARPFLENPGMRRIARRVLSLALAFIAIWFARATAR